MYIKIFLVQVLCATAVFCRTSQDVINDFEPVYQERHDTFSEMESSLEDVALHQHFQSLIDHAASEKYKLIYLLLTTHDKITTETNKYLEETGMITKPEKITHCTNFLKGNRTKVQGFTKAGDRLCDQFRSKLSSKIQEPFIDHMTKLENEHATLNATRDECVKLPDPFEVQSCVINDLYTFYVPYIQDLKTVLNTVLQEIGDGVHKGIEQDETCYAFVKENLKVDAQKTIDDFKLCVWWEI